MHTAALFRNAEFLSFVTLLHITFYSSVAYSSTNSKTFITFLYYA